MQIMTSICFTTPSSNDFQTHQKFPVMNPKNMAKLIAKSGNQSQSRTITILDSPKNIDNSNNNKQDYFKNFGRLLTLSPYRFFSVQKWTEIIRFRAEFF